MRATRGKVLVKVNMSQKSDYEFVTPGGLRLWANSDFGTNQHEVAPTVCVVVDPGGLRDLSPGDVVVCHQNTFNSVVNDKGALLGDTGEQDGRLRVFAVDERRVLLKLDKDLNPIPLEGWMVVERIEHRPESDTLYIPDTAVKPVHNRLRVLAISQGCEGVEPGDEVVVYDKSGVDCVFNYNGVKKTVVRCRYDNVLAVMENQ
jgi:hypothetical protein